MLRRKVYIENQRVLADSGEIIIDINVTDPISALWFDIRAINGAINNVNNPVAGCIDTIQLLDGGDVICSLSGVELLVNAIEKLRSIPAQLVTEVPNGYQSMNAPLLFGRWFGDQQFSFVAGSFKNPQIRFKWNLGAVRAVGADSYVTGSGRLTIVADVMEGAPNPVAIITAKRHYLFATAGSGVEAVELPTDQPIKALQLRSALLAGAALAGITHVKLHGDQSKVVILDHDRYNWIEGLTVFHNALVYKHSFHAMDGVTVYPLLKYLESVNIEPQGPDEVTGYVSNGAGQGLLYVYRAGAAAVANINLVALVTGYMPFNSVYQEFGDYDDPNTWLNPSGFKSLRLELTQNVAAAQCSIVLEQARPL
jgi:hypothetical protein